MKPIRIQRKRTKGWRIPLNTVYVGRPSKWGNPYTGLRAVEEYRDRLEGNKALMPDLFQEVVINPLRGKNLCCWCPIDQECHADILLEMVNKQ